MHYLQNMPETVAVYLAGIQCLRAFKQHLELLMRLIQMLRLFRYGVFKRAIQRMQLGRHVVERPGKLAQFVWQRGIRCRRIELPPLNALAGRHQIIQR